MKKNFIYGILSASVLICLIACEDDSLVTEGNIDSSSEELGATACNHLFLNEPDTAYINLSGISGIYSACDKYLSATDTLIQFYTHDLGYVSNRLLAWSQFYDMTEIDSIIYSDNSTNEKYSYTISEIIEAYPEEFKKGETYLFNLIEGEPKPDLKFRKVDPCDLPLEITEQLARLQEDC